MSTFRRKVLSPGKTIDVEYKKAIVAVKEYFDRTSENAEEQRLTSVEKTAHALDVGVATVKRIMADHNRLPTNIDQTPPKRGRPPHAITDLFQTATRKYIRQGNIEGRHLTVEMVCNHLNSLGPDQPVIPRTMNRTLDRWGFTFGKGTRSQHLKEKDYVIAARQKYLRRKVGNRRGTGVIKPEIYLDESYINKNHSNDYVWYLESDGPWIQKPTGKGERLILINAISCNGWVENAKLVFKSKRKTGDYHGQMNNGLFSKWFKEKLLPNIPDNSLIIMDNAPYHNILSPHSAPTSSCKKERIKMWLEDYGYPLKDDCLKVEMIDILKNIAPKPTYEVDEIASNQGHEILRTPPYHPELQPIEICWGLVKNSVARHCDFTMANLLNQLDIAFDCVTKKTCSGLVNKIRKIEDDYRRDDLILEKGN